MAAYLAVLSRDRALTALDGGDPVAALAIAGEGLAMLEAAGAGGGPDGPARLVASAVTEGAAGDSVLLCCQAQERMAGLERLAGEFDAAAARLTAAVDRAATAFGEASPAVVSAANALGVVYKYAADFDAAEKAYRRAMAAADGQGDPDPLILAGLLHNMGGLAHARGDAMGGIPLAERGVALRTGVLGAGHSEVACDWNALGALYHRAGRLDDAAQIG